MTIERTPASGQPTLRRNAIWPWVVMPVIILALFTLLHSVRRSGGELDQGSSFGSGMP